MARSLPLHRMDGLLNNGLGGGPKIYVDHGLWNILSRSALGHVHAHSQAMY